MISLLSLSRGDPEADPAKQEVRPDQDQMPPVDFEAALRMELNLMRD